MFCNAFSKPILIGAPPIMMALAAFRIAIFSGLCVKMVSICSGTKDKKSKVLFSMFNNGFELGSVKYMFIFPSIPLTNIILPAMYSQFKLMSMLSPSFNCNAFKVNKALHCICFLDICTDLGVPVLPEVMISNACFSDAHSCNQCMACCSAGFWAIWFGWMVVIYKVVKSN